VHEVHSLHVGVIMPTMLDWYTGLVGYNSSDLRLGELMAVNRNGEIEWRKDRAEIVMGSYQSKVLVGRSSSSPEMRAAAERLGLLVNPEVLWVSGNPVKFLQGHNAFGPSVLYLGSIVKAFVRELPPEVRPLDADSDLWPAVHRSRVDITTMVDLGSHACVHEWLQAAATRTRSRHGRPLVSGDTVYWGQHSRRWSMKAYCKLCELQVNPCADYRLNDLLKSYSEGKLRVELTLRRLELKDKGILAEDLIWEYFSKITFGVIEMSKLKNGRPNLRPLVEVTFNMWLAGGDVRMLLPRRTFYKYRREIIDEVGVDISIPSCEQKKEIEQVKFDLDYLKAHELKNVPDYLQGFLFRPEKCSS